MSYPVLPSAPYVPSYNPAPNERKQPSALGETIFCIALSALSFFVSNITKHHDRGLSNFCRILPAGILVIWFLRRIGNSSDSSYRHSTHHNYQNTLPTPPIIVFPPSTPSSYSVSPSTHSDSIHGYQTNPYNSSSSSSHQNYVPQSKNNGHNDSINSYQTNSYNSSSLTNHHLAPQHRNTGNNDQIRYQ